MIPGIRLLLSKPSLTELLSGQFWREDISRVVLDRSRKLTGPNRMLDLKISKVPEGYQAEAKVKGEGGFLYFPIVDFWLDAVRGEWDVFTECSCEVFDCQHAIAILERIWLEMQDTGPIELSESERAAQALETVPEVCSWLARLEKLSRKKPARKKAKGSRQSKFLVYCILPAPWGDSGALGLELHLARHARDGLTEIDLDSRASPNVNRPPAYLKDEDILLVKLVQNLGRFGAGYGGWLELEGVEGFDLLGRLLASGRLYFVNNRGHDLVSLLAEGAPRPLTLGWRREEGGVRPVLQCDPELLVIPTWPPMAIDRLKSTLCRLDCGDAPAALVAAWAAGPLVPDRVLDSVAGRIAGTASRLLPPVPPQMEPRVFEDLEPSPCLTIRRVCFDLAFRPRSQLVLGEVTFRYGESPPVPPSDSLAATSTEIYDGESFNVVRRDVKKERVLQDRLDDFGLVPLHRIMYGSGGLPAALRQAVLPENALPSAELRWLEFLYEGGAETLRAEGWIVEAEESAGLVMHDVPDFVAELRGDAGIDWFRFDAAFEVNGKRFSLIPVIAAFLEQNEEIPDPEDPASPEWVILPSQDPAGGVIRFPARRFFELVGTVRHLLSGASDSEGALRVHRLQAADLAARLPFDGAPAVAALKKLGETLRDFTALPRPDPPSELRGTLRPYQTEGFHWMQFLARNDLHGILADDMGLGKTVQALAHLLAEKAGGHSGGKPSLVVAPTSVVPNWEAEAERFAPSLETLVLHGPERTGLFERISQADLVVTSYALLMRDHTALKMHSFHAVLLDEAQHVKNPQAKTAQLVCDLDAAHRMCLSGTPLQNHLGELWSLMRFLMPGYLGDPEAFRRCFRTPIEKFGDKGAQASLNRRVAPLLLRRTKDQVAGELPPKTEIVHRIALTQKQVDLYESVRAAMDKRVRDAIAAKGLERSHIIVLDALLKLRQICCHPKLLKTPAAQKVKESAKLVYLTDELMPTLIEEGRRILLFSQFTTMLALIEAWFVEEKVPFVKLTGRTRDRKEVVKAFQTGEVPVFLISLKAGGTGLNLTAADTVIHYDPWWNPAVEEQATDRAHRIGQDKPVFVHKLICEGTIEERIQELQAKKSALVEALLGENANKLQIDKETLSNLLAPMA
ncbi:MAG TPA: DEAD/DEAH box helicase [Verrucomicrobiales bacterium]|nr:DEAD/DEAH box helicase [Verrucomicrobiales bacterium]